MCKCEIFTSVPSFKLYTSQARLKNLNPTPIVLVKQQINIYTV